MALAQISYGVKLELELPADQHLVAFIANPIGYATQHLDVLDVRGFVELERVGLAVRYRSATKAFAGIYYVLTLQELFGQFAEATFGFYAGRDFRQSETYFTLKGSILIYGSIKQGLGARD